MVSEQNVYCLCARILASKIRSTRKRSFKTDTLVRIKLRLLAQMSEVGDGYHSQGERLLSGAGGPDKSAVPARLWAEEVRLPQSFHEMTTNVNVK